MYHTLEAVHYGHDVVHLLCRLLSLLQRGVRGEKAPGQSVHADGFGELAAVFSKCSIQ